MTGLCILMTLTTIVASICIVFLATYKEKEKKFSKVPSECVRLHSSVKTKVPFAPPKPEPKINLKA